MKIAGFRIQKKKKILLAEMQKIIRLSNVIGGEEKAKLVNGTKVFIEKRWFVIAASALCIFQKKPTMHVDFPEKRPWIPPWEIYTHSLKIIHEWVDIVSIMKFAMKLKLYRIREEVTVYIEILK